MNRRLLPGLFLILAFAMPLFAGISIHDSTMVVNTYRQGERLVASQEKIITENQNRIRIWLTHYMGSEAGWSLPFDFDGPARIDQMATHFNGDIWLLGRTVSHHSETRWNRVFLIGVSPDGQMFSSLYFAILDPANPTLSVDAMGDVHLSLYRNTADLSGYLFQAHVASSGQLQEVSRMRYRARGMAQVSEQPLLGLEENVVTWRNVKAGKVIHLETLFSEKHVAARPAGSLTLEQIGIPIDPEPEVPDLDAPPPP